MPTELDSKGFKFYFYFDERSNGMSTSDSKIVNKKASDPLGQLIFEEGLRIQQVWFDRSLDLVVVLLNNKKIIKHPISDFKRLTGATPEQLHHFENDGVGIHWPDVDEDLSLRGFLKYELAHKNKPMEQAIEEDGE